MPSRLLQAFPAGVPVRRLPLDEAIARVEERLAVAAPAALEYVK
jgi:ATP-dependent DNA helicase DinG